MGRETSFMRLKKAILELKDGYPEYVFYGKIEYFVKTGTNAVDILDKHEIIEKLPREEVVLRINNMSSEERARLPLGEDRYRWYRLTAKGIDLAISMINLDYSEKMNLFTKIILLLGIGTFIFTLEQILLLLFL
ncbi:MAG: hypothetical protein WC511_01420 [Candidatus Pacearchaeota archaeon]